MFLFWLTIYILGLDGCNWGLFNLNDLKSLSIHCFYGKWELQYTPCRNSDGCDEDGGLMVKQTNPNNDESCTTLAKWDNGNTKPVKIMTASDAVYSYDFKYQNGASSSQGDARNTTIVFICNPDAIPYDENNLECGEPSRLNYEIFIPTYLACVNNDDGSNNKASLSGGSIFVIFFVSVVFSYCLFGYIAVWKLKNKNKPFGNYKDNIPQYEYWIVLPVLVKTGCMVSYEWLMTKIRKNQFDENNTDALL
eukprot:203908_1